MTETISKLKPSIAACCFVSFDEATGLFPIKNEKLYYYFNFDSLIEGALALTFNGTAFGVVQVVRNVFTPSPFQYEAAKKPLLSALWTEGYTRNIETIANLKKDDQWQRLLRKVEEDRRVGSNFYDTSTPPPPDVPDTREPY